MRISHHFVLTLMFGFLFPLGIRAQDITPEEQKYLLSTLPLIDSGHLAKAEEKLIEGLKLYPNSAIIHNGLGIVYQKENKIGAAVDAFQTAIRLLPSFTAAQLHLALIYEEQDKRAEAIELYKAVGKSTSHLEALTTAGVGLAQCEDFKAAIDVLEKARSLQPNSFLVGFNLALAYYKTKDWRSASNVLESVRPDGEGDKADLLFLRGKIKQSLNQNGSQADFAEACRLMPSMESYCVDAGLTLMKLERFAEALAALQKGVEKNPSSSALLSALGLVQFRLGRYQEAIQSYSRVIEKNPAADASREGLAFLLYITGDLGRARDIVEKGLENPSADFYLSQLHAMILYRISRDLWARALDSLGQALKKNPNFAPAHFLKGKIEMEKEHLDVALLDFQKAAELDPSYPLPHYRIAQIYLRKGLLREAEAAKTKFSKLGDIREEDLLTRQTQDLLMQATQAPTSP